MKVPKSLYLIFAVSGTIVPWFFFAVFFAKEGLNVPLFIQSLVHNGAAGGFTADLLISILVFWVWSYNDAKQNNVKGWWIVLPTGFLVGLSLALPFYLFLRSRD